MSLIVGLFLSGILLLALEVIVPGAILGIAGGLCLLGGVIASFVTLGATAGFYSAGIALAVAAVVLYFEFVFLPRSRLARKFSMTGTVEGQSQPPIADRAQVVGREAVAVTALAPSGFVEVSGRRYEAFARSGYAAAGTRLSVIDVDNFRLIVQSPTPVSNE